MSFFPRTLMPLTVKADAPNAPESGPTTILSDGWNTHDQEIRAIQQFLGTIGNNPQIGVKPRPPFAFFSEESDGSQTQDWSRPDQMSTGFVNEIWDATERLNFLISSDGVSVSSGYCVSNPSGGQGQAMVFPEQSFGSRLMSSLSLSGTSIQVEDATGFPRTGIVSILNTVETVIGERDPETGQPAIRRASEGVSTVEWIRYSGIVGNTLIGCQRGILGTTATAHASRTTSRTAAKPIGGGSSLGAANSDSCFLSPANTTTCSSFSPAWANRTIYNVPSLGLSGTREFIRNSLRVLAGEFRVFSGDPSSSKLRDLASSLGLLGSRADGSFYFLSADSGEADVGRLTVDEAVTLAEGIIGSSAISSIKTGSTTEVASYQSRVYSGKISVSHSLAAIAESPTVDMKSARIFQQGDGRLFVFTNDKSTPRQVAQAVVGYTVFYVPSSVNDSRRTFR